MARKLCISGCLVLLSTMFGCLGYVFGVPASLGPCGTDAQHTCAFACKPVSGAPGISVACTDTHEPPYCQNTNQNQCNPSAAVYQCKWTFYTDTKCSQGAKSQYNYVPCCQ